MSDRRADDDPFSEKGLPSDLPDAQSTQGATEAGDLTFEIAINSEIRYKADLKTDARARYSLTHNYEIRALTIRGFAAEIAARNNFTSICIDGSGRFHRSKENFRKTSIIGIDIDNDGGEYFSLDDAISHPFVKQSAGLIYTTASHTPTHHKFRIVFFLPRPITDREEFERILRALIHIFKSDEACKDCSRFFYGAGERGQVITLGNLLTDETIERLLSDYDAAHTRPVPSSVPQVTSSADGFNRTDYNLSGAEERRRAYGERIREAARRMIFASRPPSGSLPGNRHEARTHASYLLGGAVAGGLLSHWEAMQALEDAVRANTEDYSGAMKTVQDCFEAGRAEPITFEDKERERALYLATLPKPHEEAEELEPGEIPADPPVSQDPEREAYLRRVLANSSRLTRARMFIVAALGMKVPWRLLNAIHSFQKGSLRIKMISDAMLATRYRKTGESASLSSIRRDKEKLWEAQRRAGVELVWYKAGTYNPQTDEHFASMYQSNLDRWALEAIDMAIARKGSYQISDEELQANCVEIAARIRPESPESNLPPREKPEKDAFTREQDAQEALKKIASRFDAAWDEQELTTAERQIRAENLLRSFGAILMAPDKSKRTREQKKVAAMVNAIMPGGVVKNGHTHNTDKNKGVTENAPVSRPLEPENGKPCMVLTFDHHAPSENGSNLAPASAPAAVFAAGETAKCPGCSKTTLIGYVGSCPACRYLFTRHYWRANYPQACAVGEARAVIPATRAPP